MSPMTLERAAQTLDGVRPAGEPLTYTQWRAIAVLIHHGRTTPPNASPLAISDAYRSICRLLDPTNGFPPPAWVVDRVAMLVEADENAVQPEPLKVGDTVEKRRDMFDLVSGSELKRLPVGSLVASVFGGSPHFRRRDTWIDVDRGMIKHGTGRYRVLYHAPEPEPEPEPLKVGDPVETEAQLEALPIDTVIRDNETFVFHRWKWHDGTPASWMLAGNRTAKPVLPARVLDLPGGAS